MARLWRDERVVARQTARALIPVIYEEQSQNWLASFHEADQYITRNVVKFGMRGKHVNSLAWRVARRYGRRERDDDR